MEINFLSFFKSSTCSVSSRSKGTSTSYRKMREKPITWGRETDEKTIKIVSLDMKKFNAADTRNNKTIVPCSVKLPSLSEGSLVCSPKSTLNRRDRYLLLQGAFCSVLSKIQCNLKPLPLVYYFTAYFIHSKIIKNISLLIHVDGCFVLPHFPRQVSPWFNFERPFITIFYKKPYKPTKFWFVYFIWKSKK